MPEHMAHQMWNRMIRHYFDGQPDDLIAHRIEQIDVVACVRNFSWLALSDSFPEDVIRQCQQIFHTRVEARKEHIFNVCQTLSDWTLD